MRAIEVEHLSKRYRLGEYSLAYRTLREALSGSLGRSRRSQTSGDLWALRDVDLALEQGEVVGVVGRNGAGKSTLLKIVARITEPTTGVSRTRGRVGALLEVGTGFHPELTGKENVYLNGAVLGMSRKDIGRRFDEIIEFAGVERFLDTPLKRYSSGMYLRLAFAVAAHLEPDIVIVDEVLAVGDEDFRQKCLGRMSRFGREGRTVLFVSHDLGAITQLCQRAVWLDRGSIRTEGRAGEVVDRYLRSTVDRTPHVELAPELEKVVQVRSVTVTDESGAVLETARRNEPFSIRVRFVLREKIHGLDIEIYLLNGKGVQVLSESWSDTGSVVYPQNAPEEFEASLTIPPILAADDYIVGVCMETPNETFVCTETLGFRLWPRPDDRDSATRRRRVVQPEVSWRLSAVSERRPVALQ